MASFAYHNDVTLTTSYADLVAGATVNAMTPTAPDAAIHSLGTIGLLFYGTLLAKSTNVNDVLIQSKKYATLNSTLGVTDPPIVLQGVDLSQIQVKSATAGDIVKLNGVIR